MPLGALGERRAARRLAARPAVADPPGQLDVAEDGVDGDAGDVDDVADAQDLRVVGRAAVLGRVEQALVAPEHAEYRAVLADLDDCRR